MRLFYSPLFELLQKDRLLVNSYHHQGIRDLAPTLQCMAQAPDGLAEAVYAQIKAFYGQCNGILSFLMKQMKTVSVFFRHLSKAVNSFSGFAVLDKLLHLVCTDIR